MGNENITKLRGISLKFSCDIDNVRTLKKGMKITLFVNQDDSKEVLKKIYNFLDKDLNAILTIDKDKYLKKLNRISEEQRRKIFAILRDISYSTGQNVESLKETLKDTFVKTTENVFDFSLSNCHKDLASDFIEYLISFCFKMGIALHENPMEAFDSLDRYLAICLDYKKCSVCSKPAEHHHWQAIGMGRNRKTADDSKNEKIALCREHHTEAHTIGRESFKAKYHVYGIVWDK